MIVFTRAVAFMAICFLAGCGGDDLSKPPTPIGDFRLGYDIVVDTNAKTAGPSRTAEPGEWREALKSAIDQRIGRYDGDKLYHLGVGVNGYALAVPGIPILLSPKSILVITVTVWDDTAQRPVNAEAKELTIFESINGQTVVGSGLTKTREEQIETLSANAARAINEWLVENKAWFSPEAVAARAAMAPTALTPAQTKAVAEATPVNPNPVPAAPAN